MQNLISRFNFINRILVKYHIYLLVFIVLVWCIINGRTNLLAWQLSSMGGDANFVLAWIKIFAQGEITPITWKFVSQLGAPFEANWNDYPLTEELIFATIGYIARIVGLFPAGNVFLLGCSVLAGLCFAIVAKKLKAKNEYIFLCAIAYAFSHYIFARSFLGHVNLIFYWHLPFLCFISWYCLKDRLWSVYSKEYIWILGVSFLTGALNPYYTWMYLQFVGFALLKHLIRRNWQLTLNCILVVSCTITSFIVFNLDSLTYSLVNGSNRAVVGRDLAGLEIYGLKLPELFLPNDHRWQSLANFAQSHYYIPSFIKGEIGSPYLGFIGIIGFIVLFAFGLYRILQGQAQRIHASFWQVLWILLYSLIGGVNLIFGSFGLILFRGTNRFSIFILTISLLFLAWVLSRYLPSKRYRIIALLLVPLVLWDQLPNRVTQEQLQNLSVAVDADRQFALKLERELPKRAMVFQLPVMPFPEYPPIVNMSDYEHFRPFLFTTHLRYSYGSNKGRSDTEWQKVIEKLATSEMVKKLEEYGFSAIIINRKGYVDKGAERIVELQALGNVIISDSTDMIAFKITPLLMPSLPIPLQSFGWSEASPGL